MSATPDPIRTPLRRRLLLAAAVLILVIVTVWTLARLSRTDLPIPYDFAAFWAAGRLNAQGLDPYLASSVRDLQRSVGLDDTAIIMWNPPWTLSLVMPFGALDLGTSYRAWVSVNL